jgi:hypothetical protein
MDVSVAAGGLCTRVHQRRFMPWRHAGDIGGFHVRLVWLLH